MMAALAGAPPRSGRATSGSLPETRVVRARRLVRAVCAGAAAAGAAWLLLEWIVTAVLVRHTVGPAAVPGRNALAGLMTHYLAVLLMAAMLSGVFGGMVAAVAAGARRSGEAALAGAASAALVAGVSALLLRLFPTFADFGSLAVLALPLMAAGAAGALLGRRLMPAAAS